MSRPGGSAAAAVPPLLPPNYQTVLDVIQAAGYGSHLSSAEVWVRARAVRPRIGFATVHRGLIRLHALGAVMKIDVPGEASSVYEPAAGPHAHFRCSACGAIRDLAFTLPADTLRSLGAGLGIAIDEAAITFAGRCAGCA